MKNDFDPELESLVGAELKKLPCPPAPRALIPRVLALVEARARLPWWQRTWWDWPLAAKATFLLLVLAVAGFMSERGLILGDAGTQYSESVTRKLDLVSAFWNLLLVFVNVAEALWATLGQPYLLYLVAIALVAYLVCIGAGTLFLRVAAQRLKTPLE